MNKEKQRIIFEKSIQRGMDKVMASNYSTNLKRNKLKRSRVNGTDKRIF